MPGFLPLLISAASVRARFECAGPNRENMDDFLEDVLRRFGFCKNAFGDFRRSEPFDDLERADLLQAVWEEQARFGPDTRLVRLEVWQGLEVIILLGNTVINGNNKGSIVVG